MENIKLLLTRIFGENKIFKFIPSAIAILIVALAIYNLYFDVAVLRVLYRFVDSTVILGGVALIALIVRRVLKAQRRIEKQG